MSSGRLRTEALARLLAQARLYGFESALTTLILGNPQAVVSYQQLVDFRMQGAQHLSWREVAEVLAAVDLLVEQLADWPLPLVRRSARKMPLELLAAAVELRCAECEPAERPALEDVQRRLLDLIRLRPAQPAELPKAPAGKRGRKR